MRNPRPVLRNKSIGKVMQRLLPIDTRDAIRQESVLRSHLKLGRAHVEVVADAGSMDEHQSGSMPDEYRFQSALLGSIDDGMPISNCRADSKPYECTDSREDRSPH
jgi:hypothetical protein